MKNKELLEPAPPITAGEIRASIRRNTEMILHRLKGAAELGLIDNPEEAELGLIDNPEEHERQVAACQRILEKLKSQ